MKKYLLAASSAILAFGLLVGCSGEGENPTDENQKTNIQAPGSSNELPASNDSSDTPVDGATDTDSKENGTSGDSESELKNEKVDEGQDNKEDTKSETNAGQKSQNEGIVIEGSISGSTNEGNSEEKKTSTDNL